MSIDCYISAEVCALNNILVSLCIVSATFLIQFLIIIKPSGSGTRLKFSGNFPRLFLNLFFLILFIYSLFIVDYNMILTCIQ